MSIRLAIANQVSALGPPVRGSHIRIAAFRWAGVTVRAGTRICQGVWIPNSNVFIGQRVWVGAHSRLIATHEAAIDIGDDCALGPETLVMTGTHHMGDTAQRAGDGYSESIRVGPGCWLGTRATLIAGADVGGGTVVAAGSLVRDQTGPDVVVAGIPAQVVRSLPRRGSEC